MSNRPAFLKFVATSPLLASVDQAADGLDVFDFQAAAQKVVPPVHWDYRQTDGGVSFSPLEKVARRAE